MLCDRIFNGVLIQAVPFGRHWLTVTLCVWWVANGGESECRERRKWGVLGPAVEEATKIARVSDLR